MTPTDDIARRLTGRSLPTPEPRTLRAGPVRALLDGADLRHIRVGDAELVQRVYVAVRDAPWNTIPATFDDWAIDETADRFVVRFSAAHRHADIDFRWRGSIVGSADGTIRYVLDGTCHGAFRYSKIGFNVHHGPAESVGRPFRLATDAGELTGILPAAIEPQRIVDGTLTGMYEPFRELALEVAPGLEAVIGLEGDLLELQDHRNWTDGNFKSYGTPLALGFPFDAVDGQVIRQVLTIGFRGTAPAPRPAGPPTLRLGDVVAPSVPPIGYLQAGHGRPLSESEADRLRPLRPDHLRVEISPTPEGLAALDRAVADAVLLGGVALELAVFANEGSGPALAELARRLRQRTSASPASSRTLPATASAPSWGRRPAPSASRVVVQGLPAGSGTMRVLDLASVERAMRDPGGFRADTRPIRIPAALELELGPYATACIDAPVGA